MRDKIVMIFLKLKSLQHVELGMLYSQYIPILFSCKSLTLVNFERYANDVTDDQKNYLISNENPKFIQRSFDY
jgi:hypothetical protein